MSDNVEGAMLRRILAPLPRFIREAAEQADGEKQVSVSPCDGSADSKNTTDNTLHVISQSTAAALWTCMTTGAIKLNGKADFSSSEVPLARQWRPKR